MIMIMMTTIIMKEVLQNLYIEEKQVKQGKKYLKVYFLLKHFLILMMMSLLMLLMFFKMFKRKVQNRIYLGLKNTGLIIIIQERENNLFLFLRRYIEFIIYYFFLFI